MPVVTKLDKLTAMAKEKSSERRRALLREITDLFFESTPDADSDASHQFDDVLSTLAQQAAVEAREELSERFADADHAPRGLIMQLAQDAIEVAAPILSRSSALSDDDLLSLAEEAGQGHLKAISQRPEVSESLSEAIVRRGDDDTVATLVGNEGAKLSRDTFETVTRRAETSPALHAPLAEREDTPVDLLNDLMHVVGNHVRDSIIKRFDSVDPRTLDQAIKASQARLAQRMADDKDLEEARRFISAMAVRRKLDGALLVKLLREKERMKFCVGFAELTGVDITAARQAIEQESVDPLALICKAAGLEKALFVTFAVLRASAQHAAFKDAQALGDLYDGLSISDAERAIRFWKMRKDVAA